MSIHDGFQELAASALDFELTDTERSELDLHLAGCDLCRRTLAGYRNDAVAIGAGPVPRLAAERATLVLERALRPPRRSSPMRLLAVAALLTVVGGGVIAAGMGIARLTQDPTLAVMPTPSPTPRVSSGPSPQPSPSTPSASATPAPPANVGSLPVAGSAILAGTGIRMSAGSRGDLYVSIPTDDGMVLTLLDSRGVSREGWPVRFSDVAACDWLGTADDGTVRVLCTSDPGASPYPLVHAFALDASGQALPGWPVSLVDHGADGLFAARVIGNNLALFAWTIFRDERPQGEQQGSAWMIAVGADGQVRNGTIAGFARYVYDKSGLLVPTERFPDGDWAIGPDGVAYGIIRRFDDDPFTPKWTSELRAVSFAGVPAGFPPFHDSPARDRIFIDGIASRPAVDGAGMIRMTVAREPGGPARLGAFAPDGTLAVGTEIELGLVAAGTCVGIEGTCVEPAAPSVGVDGTTMVIGIGPGGTTAAATDRDYGGILAGWPYHSSLGLQTVGLCPTGAVCDSGVLAAPALGPDNVLYLIHAEAIDAEGGSLVAVGIDGRVVEGWPVGLKRNGSAFWSVVVGADRTVYALAVEPEVDDGSSATIVAFKPDSTVRYRSTIIDP